MISPFHFIRPGWLLLLFLILPMMFLLFKRNRSLESWSAICDKPLLDFMRIQYPTPQRYFSRFLLLLSALFMIIGLAGPSWIRLPVPTYTQIQPKVFLLDLSQAILAKDVLPSRLDRAKFILHDIFNQYKLGQFGLIAYTAEPFVVSPLTDDVQTIEALISSLHPDIMPIGGQRLDNALEQAAELIHQAKFNYGQIVVITANLPNKESLGIAKKLGQNHIFTSVMPIYTPNDQEAFSFQTLAAAGQGKVLSFSRHSKDLLQLFSSSPISNQLERSQDNEIPLWRDEGRWFLLPAILFLLPAFRKGWLQRVF